jgi:hypothetical protein
MPRRRNTDEFSLEATFELKNKCTLVGNKLKNEYFDMAKKLNVKLECGICFEEICCRDCFCMTNCGNTYHLHEYIRCDFCPTCRD